MRKVIFHVDVNSAFLSWEAVYRMYHLGGRVDLRQKVAAVGGDMALRHGIILAKSIPAGKYGVRTGQSIVEALQQCPQLQLVPPNYGLYDRCSRAFLDILKQYSPVVEPYSVDEAFVDMTGTEGLWGGPETAADKIRCQIREELGFTVNIGVAENKLLAKMASDFRKPDRVHTLWPEEVRNKMWPLPVSDLFFVGSATAGKLFRLGIRTIGELAETEPEILRSHLKKQGEVIWAFANGMDVSVVQDTPAANKGYGNSTTIAFDVTDASTARMVLLALAETVGARLRKAGVQAEIIAVGIKDCEFRYSSHQRAFENATDITWEIYQRACRLFEEMWDGRPIRHLGIHTSRVRDRIDLRQIDLFDAANYEKLSRADLAVDDIRVRYGNDAVKRAVFLGSRVDHMAGGISKEKRQVDYTRTFWE